MQRALDEQLYDWPSETPRLKGSKCRQCASVSFPQQASCAKCTANDSELIDLPTDGILWSWTTQEFPPASPPYIGCVQPADFKPFYLGYVQLGDLVCVQSRLTLAADVTPEIGMPLELHIEEFAEASDGGVITSYAFRNASGAA